MVQWLRLHAPGAEGLDLFPGQGTRFHMLQLNSLHASSKDLTCHNVDRRCQVPQLRLGATK